MKLYQIDAFADGPFTGNPAAVVPLKQWIDDDLMQNIALENNLSETAFIVEIDNGYHIRWFTPNVEVDLCGHATMASAYVIFNYLGYENEEISFQSKSGELMVTKADELLILNFPTDELEEIDPVTTFDEALGVKAIAYYKGKTDYMLIFENQSQLEQMTPDFNLLCSVKCRGLLVTAPGDEEYDFVSRGFFPLTGINEDPATGSAHTSLTPYWSKRLGKKEMKACQLSYRKGFLQCTDLGHRISIAGKCNPYLVGEINI